MPNGRHGDNPITDLFYHEEHPFPCDIEAMIIKLREIDSLALGELVYEPFDWAKRRNLDHGRKKLQSLLLARGQDPKLISRRARI